MGDRCNIVIRTEGNPAPANLADAMKGSVVLYGHWSGEEMPIDLARALNLRQRWDDPAYLARIIFCEFVGDDTGTTGFGISSGELCDNERPVLCVNTYDNTIVQYGTGYVSSSSNPARAKSWSYDDFIRAPEYFGKD